MDWLSEGELEITRDVFRDLGIAFAAALVGIYAILIYQTGSYAMPLILMISIPLTLIGILPGFWLLSAGLGRDVGGFANPVFSGLAWALIFGLFVSTAFTLLVVPAAYYRGYLGRPGHGLREEA
ncbi:MAG: hypothetical protein ACE5IL_07240 [Myxococcota bacterium]